MIYRGFELKTFYVNPSEDGSAFNDQYLIMSLVQLWWSLIFNPTKYGSHLRVDCPVCRNNNFCTTEYLHNLNFDHSLDVCLHEVDFGSTKNINDFTTPELFRQYILFHSPKNRNRFKTICPFNIRIGVYVSCLRKIRG